MFIYNHSLQKLLFLVGTSVLFDFLLFSQQSDDIAMKSKSLSVFEIKTYNSRHWIQNTHALSLFLDLHKYILSLGFAVLLFVSLPSLKNNP